MLLLAFSFSLYLSLAQCEDASRSSPRDTELLDSYDFVVVGGGTSGLTVADRLTENPNVTVLVIERGPLDHHEPAVMVPGLLNLETTPYWYNLTSTPQTELTGGGYQVPAAKVVGGGTVINGMFFDRGSAADYDAWEELGNAGWNWKSLLPYFKKSETFTPADSSYSKYDISWSNAVHGFSGPVRASYPPYQFPSTQNFFQGWLSKGVTIPKDPGAGTAYGAFWAPSSLDPTDETRASSRRAHYDRVKYRSNYHLITNTAVSRITFEGKRAVGVQLHQSGTSITAKSEVILAAGVHSPQMLQLSGIGPSQILSKHGIDLVANLPGVGQNFQDHPTLYALFNFTKIPHPTSDELTSNDTFIEEQLNLYWTQREGAYTITHLAGNAVAFLPLPNITSDYQSIASLAGSAIPAPLNDAPSSYLTGYKAQRAIISRLYGSTNASVQETGFGAGSGLPITLVKPLSRGSITIKSSNVLDEPAVDFAAFTHPSDIEIMVAALKVNRELIQTPSMQALAPIELSPGANVTTDEEIKQALRQNVVPTYSHPCCANPMMPQDLGGVVDQDLLVYGVEGLSVVDASIMPMIPATHLSATVYAVAEKAADLIKARHGLLA